MKYFKILLIVLFIFAFACSNEKIPFTPEPVTAEINFDFGQEKSDLIFQTKNFFLNLKISQSDPNETYSTTGMTTVSVLLTNGEVRVEVNNNPQLIFISLIEPRSNERSELLRALKDNGECIVETSSDSPNLFRITLMLPGR